MDLLKDFDCLPHEMLLDKLSAYGVLFHSISLLQSNSTLISWADIHKGFPQGSILGPLLLYSFEIIVARISYLHVYVLMLCICYLYSVESSKELCLCCII